MSQIELQCPRCQEVFQEEEAEVYECPKCGTTVKPKKDTSDHEKTQIFKI